MLALFSNFLSAQNRQNRQDYYVIAKPDYSLEPLHKSTNPDQTLTLNLVNNNLETFFNNLPVYYFSKAFPTSTTPYLQGVYLVTLDDNTHLSSIFNRNEIEYVELTEEGAPLHFPDDYFTIDGDPNTALEIIKGPQAWNITTGDPNIIDWCGR